MRRFLFSAAFAAVTVLPVEAFADPNAGAYLAAQSAAASNDFDEAAYWYNVALRADPRNPALVENTLASMIAAGDAIGAVSVARRAEDSGLQSQVVSLLLDADAARRGDWDALLAAHEAGRSVSPLVDGITRGWAHLGRGDVDSALSAFDEVTQTPWMSSFGLYHKAFALATVGDFESASAILSAAPPDGPMVTRRGSIALAQTMSQLDRNAEAAAMVSDLFGPDPDLALTVLRDKLEAGDPVPFGIVTSPAEGLAELYYAIAAVAGEDTPRSFNLIYARLAQLLNPRDAEIALHSAELLEELGNLELASAAYASIPQNDPAFYDAEIGRADVLRRADEPRLAIEVLQNLTRSFPEKPLGHIALGNALRFESRFSEARLSYSTALDRMTESDPRLWFVHYMRAVASHQLDEWPDAEADFRQALAYNPGQPQVLNYLGYSLVERGEKLDEALAMIESAVAEQPENGAIVDSLGWALFVLGRVDEAVAPMERAVELEPLDPIINDHLGDVYWTVGRYLEARFQWNRALSFDPDDDLSDRIRRKLEIGLDAVNEEDQAAAGELAVAQDE
jgi:tetratricopeptide (TPR) repeat protein